MRVAVFDVDGTLTQSSGVDDGVFVRTARELLGLDEVSTDWGTYPHSTDEAIAAHLVELARGRPATRDELDQFREHALDLLREELAAAPVYPVAGAREVAALLREEGWIPAIATGCWRPSALAKLRSAEVDMGTCGAAFACDAWPRAKIIALAVRRALALAGVDARHAPAPRVVYVGDGTWDVRACAAGGYRFVGIAKGARAAALGQEGAGTVLADYADTQAFLDALECATVPRGA